MVHKEPVIKDGDGDDGDSPEELPITVFVEEGMVTEVHYNDVPVRALVVNYDVVFPCVSAALEKDADGRYYTSIIV